MELSFYLKLLLALTMVFSVNANVDHKAIESLLNQTIDECKIRENATDEDVAIVLGDEEWPETREGKCFIECFFDAIGIFKDHKFYRRGFLALALMFFDEIDDDKSEEVEEFDHFVSTINDKCGAIKTSDRCENAFEFAKCCDHIFESFHLLTNDISAEDVEQIK